MRDAMIDAAGNAWTGMREATVDVMQYQYGSEVAGVAADSADVVEGVANMGVAMKYAQPTQVRVAVGSRQEIGAQYWVAAQAANQGCTHPWSARTGVCCELFFLTALCVCAGMCVCVCADQVVLTSAKETSKRVETTEKAAAAGAANKVCVCLCTVTLMRKSGLLRSYICYIMRHPACAFMDTHLGYGAAACSTAFSLHVSFSAHSVVLLAASATLHNNRRRRLASGSSCRMSGQLWSGSVLPWQQSGQRCSRMHSSSSTRNSTSSQRKEGGRLALHLHKQAPHTAAGGWTAAGCGFCGVYHVARPAQAELGVLLID